MTREEFNDALRSAVSNDLKQIYADTPAEEHIFSKKFERRMNRLIKSVNKYGTTPFRAFCRHAAIVMASCIFLIVATTQVKAIREPIVNFITKIYEIFREITFEGNVSNSITMEYTLGYVPENFILTDTYAYSDSLVYTYTGTGEESIKFSQKITKDLSSYIDNEHTIYKTHNINDTEVILYTQDNITVAQWIQDTYFMRLTLKGTFAESEIIKMIESVCPAE